MQVFKPSKSTSQLYGRERIALCTSGIFGRIAALTLVFLLPSTLFAREPDAEFDFDQYDMCEVQLAVGGYVGADIEIVTYTITRKGFRALVKPSMEAMVRDTTPAKYVVDGTLRLYNTRDNTKSLTFVIYADFTRISRDGKYFIVDLVSLRRRIVSKSKVIVELFQEEKKKQEEKKIRVPKKRR